MILQGLVLMAGTYTMGGLDRARNYLAGHVGSGWPSVTAHRAGGDPADMRGRGGRLWLGHDHAKRLGEPADQGSQPPARAYARLMDANV